MNSAYADIPDFARLDAKWVNHMEEEQNQGSGPSQVELNKHSEAR